MANDNSIGPKDRPLRHPHQPEEAHRNYNNDGMSGGRFTPENLPPTSGYTAKVFNQVMKNLKSLVNFRPDRASELAAKKEGAEARRAGHPSAMVMKNGKMVAAGAAGLHGKGEVVAETGKGTAPLTKEELSLFEKIFIARFEGGAELGETLQKGETAKFLPKTEEGWKQFFDKFKAFVMEKKVRVADLEALTYRGVLKDAAKKEGKDIATLISDLKFTDGKTDKFARLQIQSSEIMEKLASLIPGDLLGQALVAEWLGGTEFAYQSLSYKVVNPEMAKSSPTDLSAAYQSPEKMKEAAIREGVREVSPGIALSARTEQLMAEHLDINLRGAREERGKSEERGGAHSGSLSMDRKKRKGLFGGLLGGFFGSEGEGLSFALGTGPTARKQFKGKVKWWVPLIYFVVISAVGLSAAYIFKFLLQK